MSATVSERYLGRKTSGKSAERSFIISGVSTEAAALAAMLADPAVPTGVNGFVRLAADCSVEELAEGHDSLVVNSPLQLSGTLRLALAPGHLPQLGSTFQLISATSLSGMFSNVQLPPLPAGLTWDLSRLPTHGQVRVIPEPATALSLAPAALLLTRRRRRA